jgi:hypothetical protein
MSGDDEISIVRQVKTPRSRDERREVMEVEILIIEKQVIRLGSNEEKTHAHTPPPTLSAMCCRTEGSLWHTRASAHAHESLADASVLCTYADHSSNPISLLASARALAPLTDDTFSTTCVAFDSFTP